MRHTKRTGGRGTACSNSRDEGAIDEENNAALAPIPKSLHQVQVMRPLSEEAHVFAVSV